MSAVAPRWRITIRQIGVGTVERLAFAAPDQDAAMRRQSDAWGPRYAVAEPGRFRSYLYAPGERRACATIG